MTPLEQLREIQRSIWGIEAQIRVLNDSVLRLIDDPMFAAAPRLLAVAKELQHVFARGLWALNVTQAQSIENELNAAIAEAGQP